MKIDKKVIDDLNQTIVLTLEKSDVQPKVKSELSKIAAKTQMKGFRKGKTPVAMVKKMYGQQVLVEVVNKLIEEEIGKLIEEEKYNMLGQPIPTEDHEQMEFDVHNIEDYTFSFDIGLAPQFEIKGASASDSYTEYNVQVSEKSIDEEVANIKRQNGTVEEVESDIVENDIIEVNAEEMVDGAKKEDGWATTFSVLVEGMSEAYKKEVIGKSKGDTFVFDVNELEPDKSEDYVNKYLLNKTPMNEEQEVGNMFEGTISNITRLKEAELTQELYDKLFGEGEITSEDQLRKKLTENVKNYLDDQAEKVMFGEIVSSLNDKTEMELPEAFLRRWLLTSDEGMTEEQLEEEFDDFKKGLKWTLIKEKIAREKDIEVPAEEVQQRMQHEIYSYFSKQNATPEMMQQVYASLMNNREEVKKRYDQILMEKVLGEVSKEITKVGTDIGQDDFFEKVKQFNEEQNAK